MRHMRDLPRRFKNGFREGARFTLILIGLVGLIVDCLLGRVAAAAFGFAAWRTPGVAGCAAEARRSAPQQGQCCAAAAEAAAAAGL
jgi:hypothetical protein